jgi:hypothetical protein
MDISKMSVAELKALAYDSVCELNKWRRNLDIIEAQIAKCTEVLKPEVEVKKDA